MADISQIKLPNGDTFDLIDEKSGYITAQYIENKTDYSIPVSRVGEIVVGETAIGTDSTNFPTSKAVVDYVDERVVQEIDAIDVGVTGIKANGTSLSITNGIVNIPVIGPNQSVGLITQDVLDTFANYIQSSIPTSTSQLTNDSGFITSDSDEKVESIAVTSETTMYLTGSTSNATNTAGLSKHESIKAVVSADTNYNGVAALYLGNNKINSTAPGAKRGQIYLYGQSTGYLLLQAIVGGTNLTITFPNKTGTVALTSDIPSVYSSTNTSGYLTMATLPIYDGTVV